MHPLSAMRPWLQLAFRDGVPRRSATVALLVGTLLNFINQGDLLLRGQRPNWLKLALTFLVPYCVATYGAVSMRRQLGK